MTHYTNSATSADPPITMDELLEMVDRIGRQPIGLLVSQDVYDFLRAQMPLHVETVDRFCGVEVRVHSAVPPGKWIPVYSHPHTQGEALAAYLWSGDAKWLVHSTGNIR